MNIDKTIIKDRKKKSIDYSKRKKKLYKRRTIRETQQWDQSKSPCWHKFLNSTNDFSISSKERWFIPSKQSTSNSLKPNSKLGVSKQPGHLIKPTNPPKLTRSLPNPMTLVVGGGSQPSKPKSSGSSGGFSPLKPEPPNPTKHQFRLALLRSDLATISPPPLRFGFIFLRST